MISINNDKGTGRIKVEPEDFIVEEIEKNGVALEKDHIYENLDNEENNNIEVKKDFTIFVLQKENWNTTQALIKIAKLFRRGKKSVGFAGTKDRRAISTQLCSIYKVDPSELLKLHIKDIKINGAWLSNKQVRMGDLLGNRFIVKIKDLDSYEKIEKTNKLLNGRFPNYYGDQRFGMHGDNVEIGLDMLHNNFEDAAIKFLTDTKNEKNDDAIAARERLLNELDFKTAIDYFPKYLKYERMVIDYLSKYPDNYANALRKLPRSLVLMFVHSVDSYIYNKELEERIKNNLIEPTDEDLVCNSDKFGFPDLSNISNYNDRYSSGNDINNQFVVGNIVGYNTKDLTSFEKKILLDLELTTDDFKMSNMPELSCNGNYRVFFAPYNNFYSEFNSEENSAILKFSLFTGSYATVLLNEFLDYEEV